MTWKPTKQQMGRPRPADSYRGAARNAARGSRMSLALKKDRIARGETRSQADCRRHKERMAQP